MKTAMQLMIEELEYRKDYSAFARDMIKKAKELLEKEKQQIIEAYNEGRDVEDFTANGNRYYNQTYPK